MEKVIQKYCFILALFAIPLLCINIYLLLTNQINTAIFIVLLFQGALLFIGFYSIAVLSHRLGW